MKKILIITTVLIMALSFAACGEKSNDNKDSSIGYGSNSENGSMNNNDSGMGSGITGNSSENTGSGMNSSAESNKNNSSAGSSSKSRITENHIKEKVLKHSGVKEKDLRYFDIDIDQDDGRKIYDVDFVAGNMEYSYEIDADTGDILEHEKEIAD